MHPVIPSLYSEACHQLNTYQGDLPAGFGAMARHLPRLTEGVVYALDHGMLSRSALSMLQPSSPAMDMTAAMQVLSLTFHIPTSHLLGIECRHGHLGN